MNDTINSPSEKQIKYAQSIANKRGEELPSSVLTDKFACSDYISKHASSKTDRKAEPKRLNPTPTEQQVSYATSIYEKLSQKIDKNELEKALVSKSATSKFISKYKTAHQKVIDTEKEIQTLNRFIQELNTLEYITPELREKVAGAESPGEMQDAIISFKKSSKAGYSRLDLEKLNSIQEKIIGYWLEGLQATAFESLANLENIIGDPKNSFQLDEIEEALNNHKCENINFDEEKDPTRHLVLKIEKEKSKEKKNPIVIGVLPLVAIEDYEDQKKYRWCLPSSMIPLFNRNMMGESTRCPGLMLENEEQYDDWSSKLVEDLEQEYNDECNMHLDLQTALRIWSDAFDILSEPGGGGVQGWIDRFFETRSEFWQIKKHRPVFTFVDGNAAVGPSRQVSNIYKQLLSEPETLDLPELALFKLIANVASPKKKSYDTTAEAQHLPHVKSYFGHMDSFKEGKRESFPLDPAQRDAIIALARTGNGNLLAVNGPPGTGKTSLLRGVIASEWIAPLLESQEKPTCQFIVACAATNQAVTNIISSFDESPGEQIFDAEGNLSPDIHVKIDSRWIPKLTSYGWYAPPQINEKVLKNYGKYQLIDRDGVHKPWQFKGASEGFTESSNDELEETYVKCSSAYFGVRVDLQSTLQRLRRKVVFDAQNIEKLNNQLEDWFEIFNELINTEAWTTQDEEHRKSLFEEVDQLTGNSGKKYQLERRISDLEDIIRFLGPFDTFNNIIQLYTNLSSKSLLVELPKKTEYFSILQQYNDLGALTKQLEDLRHNNFLQRIKNALSRVFNGNEIEQQWSIFRETIRSFNISIEDGPPDFDQWCHAIISKRKDLEIKLKDTAVEGIRLYLLDCGINLEKTAEYQNVWPEEVEKYRTTLRIEKSKHAFNVSELESTVHKLTSEIVSRKKIREIYLKAKENTFNSRAAIISTLHAFGQNISENDILSTSLNRAIQEALSFEMTSEGIVQLRQEIIKNTQDWLDTRIRTRIFHFAARYWEGRYIESRKTYENRIRDDSAYLMPSVEQLREMAMLAPVFVVTAFSIPKLMRRNLNNLKENLPPFLFGEADLLIVDEAGQGTPDIGASAFLFAKKSIVVGDIAQLEPVWSMGESTDKRLFQRFGIGQFLSHIDTSTYQAIKPAGISMANGSVMRMAQRATLWSNPNFPDTPGLTLTNHYRCLSPIIDICNHMVYRGALNVATRPPKKIWRPDLERVGFLVTDEISNTKKPGGSRRNQSEADCIARWIHENEKSIVKHYSTKKVAKIEDLLAIVTPFSGQKVALKKAIQKQYGLKWDEKDNSLIYNKITIDTVHTLQGAERQIVIFSMVETNDPESIQFYDKGANLINVAISRAKEMFIVAMTQNAVDYSRNLSANSLRKPSDYLWHALVKNGSRLNSRRLFLVESPNKCEVIKESLGSSIEIEVLATGGHIAELENPENWSAIEANQPLWSGLSETGEKVFNRIKSLWPDMATCYLATDPDPEGEAIAWHILRVIRERQDSGDFLSLSSGIPIIKRMRFYNLTPEEILNACNNASNGLDGGMVKSALARTILDHLISTEYPKRLGLSKTPGFYRGIGRVQLGVLDIVNKASQINSDYAVKVTVPLVSGTKMTAFAATPSQTTHELDENIWKTKNIDNANKAASLIQETLSQQEKEISANWRGNRLVQSQPYPGLNTARLLALAWRYKQLMPNEAMKSLQDLYEGLTLSNPNSAIRKEASHRLVETEKDQL